MISACLIVKNEAPWIKSCIEQIQPWATEIIVADTGSTDGTREILKELPVKLLDFAWIQDFSAARNFTIESATQPWIFSFDADERISRFEAPRVRTLVARLEGRHEYEALQIIRRDFVRNPAVSNFKPCSGDFPDVEEGQVGYYTERMVRIFRNRPHIRWTGKIHELIDPSLKGKIYQSDLVFHHYGYLPEESHRKDKIGFYTDYGQRKIQEQPQDWKGHYDLATEYLTARKLSEAEVLFSKAATLFSGEGGNRRQQEVLTLANWAYALMELQQFEEADQVMSQCLAVDPKHHDTLLNRGVLKMRQKDYPGAIVAFMTLLEKHPQSFMGFRNLGLAYAHLGEASRAVASLNQALQIFPRFTDAKVDLASLWLSMGRRERAAPLLQEILRESPGDPRVRQLAAITQQPV